VILLAAEIPLAAALVVVQPVNARNSLSLSAADAKIANSHGKEGQTSRHALR
jgi:hypothetical protein